MRQVLQSLRTVSAKTEYETAEAYAQRVRAAQTRPTDDIALLVPVPEWNTVYDAERQALKIPKYERSGYFSVTSALAPSTYASLYYIIVETNRADAGSYVASNAFGARTNVTRMRGENLGLTVQGLQQTHDFPSGGLTTMIPMDPETARRTKNHLAVLFVGDLMAPFVLTGNYVATPTLRSPYDTQYSVRSLNLRAACAVLVNRDTREIIRVLPLRS